MKKTSYEDQLVKSRCQDLLKALITEYLGYDSPPIEIVYLAKALYVVSNHPRKVINNYFDISVSVRGDGGMDYYSIELYSNQIKLSNGGSMYDEGVGSDSFSDIFYSSVEPTQHDIEREIDYWFETFNMLLNDEDGKLSIEDESEFLDEEDSEEE